MRKIAITGGTGFLGSILASKLHEEGNLITIFTRNAYKARDKFPDSFRIVEWDYHSPSEWESEINDNEVVIHLAGAGLFSRRWDDTYKKKIVESREVSSRNIVKAIRKSGTSIKLLISASGIGYYGETDSITVNEESPPGTDFLAEVCRRWEEPTYKADEKGIRRVNMRMGLILSTKEGYLKKILTPYKFFIGGPLGRSSSCLSWIHIDDVIKAYLYVIENKNIEGIVNITAPNPVTMREFSTAVGEVMHRPSYLNVPEFALKLIVGEGGKYVSFSQKVIPSVLQKSGFHFRYPEIKTALNDIINENK
jgi:uncharacterized protein